jgi:general secretion pathway protein G
LSIIAVLFTLAVPRSSCTASTSPRKRCSAENLRIVRETIDKFYGDKGRYPESLDELVSERYLRALPQDPITEQQRARGRSLRRKPATTSARKCL